MFLLNKSKPDIFDAVSCFLSSSVFKGIGAMPTNEQLRKELELEIRQQVQKEFEEVNSLVAESFELARLEKEFAAKIEAHNQKKQEIFDKKNEQSKMLEQLLSKSNMGAATAKEMAGSKALAGRRFKRDEKDGVWELALKEAKTKAKDGWISQKELIAIADELLDGSYNGQATIFWASQLKASAGNGKKVRGERKTKEYKVG